MKITPEIASEWLMELWGEQRTIRKGHVDKLASDMLAGRFKISPDSILRVKGKLANGQHRLAAVVESGKPQSFLVMDSNDEELYKVIDAGLKRTASDSLIGMQFAKALPSIARWVQIYDQKKARSNHRHQFDAIDGNPGLFTQTQTINYCIENQESLSEAASFVNPLYSQTRLLSLSIGGSLYFIAKAAGKLEKAKDFLTKVYIDGGDSSATDLRNRLIASKGAKTHLKQGYVFGLALKSLYSFCNGTRPGTLKWVAGEELPVL